MHAEDSDRLSLSFCRLLVLIRALRHGMGTKILLGLVPVIGSVMVELLIESLRVYPLTKTKCCNMISPAPLGYILYFPTFLTENHLHTQYPSATDLYISKNLSSSFS